MRVPRRLVAIVVSLAVPFAVGLPAGATNVPGPLADFQAQLAAFSLRAPGHVGIAVQDVATGVTTGINAGAEMPAASTIKIPVMVEVFRQLAAGKFDLNTRVTLRRSDKDWGSGDLAGGRAGSSYPVSRLLALMIDVSDNTATNMLIRLVGRPHINQEMEDLGLTHTRLTDFIRSEGPRIRWALRSSPADMAHLLRAMAQKQLVDEWSSREMIRILTRPGAQQPAARAAAGRDEDRAQDGHAARHAQRRRHRVRRRGPVRHRRDDDRPADALVGPPLHPRRVAARLRRARQVRDVARHQRLQPGRRIRARRADRRRAADRRPADVDAAERPCAGRRPRDHADADSLS